MHAQARALSLALAMLAGVMGMLVPRAAQAAPGFTQTCAQALARQEVEALVERQRAIAQDSPCALVRVDTSMFQTLIEWRRGERHFELLLAPRGCLREATREGMALAHYTPAELAEQCPQVQAGLDAFVGDPFTGAPAGTVAGAADPSLPALVPVVRERAPPIPTGDAAASGAGEGSWPLRVAGLAWALLSGCLIASAVRWWSRARADPKLRKGALALASMFVFALLLRASVPATLANWYGPFLPVEGLGELRFGPSGALLQLGLRALSPWSEDVAFAMVRTLGALAPVLVMLVVHRLGARPAGVALAGISLACAPIAVRLSASSSEHVLAGTLALVAWAAWLRAARDPSWTPRLLALAALLLAVLARVDCWPQLLGIGLWPLLAPWSGQQQQAQQQGGSAWLPLRRRLADAAAFALCWAAIGVFAYFELVLPSNHPGPELGDMRHTAEVLVSQLWTASSAPPHWISPLGLGAAALGLGLWLWQRRWGLALAVAAGWALVFIPLGRNLTHDGLTGARYFILALPLLAVLAAGLGHALGQGLEAYTRKGRARWRRPLFAALVSTYALLELGAARPGLRHQYTFQAEYQLLAEVLEGRELSGCTLHFVPPRQPIGEPDLDCCLAPDRSPLTLVAPELSFHATRIRAEATPHEGCQLYYLGSLCALDPALSPRSPETVAAIASQCASLRARDHEHTLVVEELTPGNLAPRFGAPPRVELRALGLPHSRR